MGLGFELLGGGSGALAWGSCFRRFGFNIVA